MSFADKRNITRLTEANTALSDATYNTMVDRAQLRRRVWRQYRTATIVILVSLFLWVFSRVAAADVVYPGVSAYYTNSKVKPASDLLRVQFRELVTLTAYPTAARVIGLFVGWNCILSKNQASFVLQALQFFLASQCSTPDTCSFVSARLDSLSLLQLYGNADELHLSKLPSFLGIGIADDDAMGLYSAWTVDDNAFKFCVLSPNASDTAAALVSNPMYAGGRASIAEATSTDDALQRLEGTLAYSLFSGGLVNAALEHMDTGDNPLDLLRDLVGSVQLQKAVACSGKKKIADATNKGVGIGMLAAGVISMVIPFIVPARFMTHFGEGLVHSAVMAGSVATASGVAYALDNCGPDAEQQDDA